MAYHGRSGAETVPKPKLTALKTKPQRSKLQTEELFLRNLHPAPPGTLSGNVPASWAPTSTTPETETDTRWRTRGCCPPGSPALEHRGCWSCARKGTLHRAVAPRRARARAAARLGQQGNTTERGGSEEGAAPPRLSNGTCYRAALTWNLGARSRGRSLRCRRSFPACAATGDAILNRKPGAGEPG